MANPKYKSAYEIVKTARSGQRPTGIDMINGCFTDFIELHGDRYFSDDRAIIGGLALLYDIPVTVIAIEKGHTLKERTEHGFGAPQPEGYRKALRLMRQAEKFKRPVICFVDTSGAYCGIDAEERGQGSAIAANLYEMIGLKVPIISVFIGEGGSGGALALAVADKVWMLENAVYSVISPEGCASIIWKDIKKAETAAEYLKMTAYDALELGVADEIISENGLGGDEFYTMLKDKLKAAADELTAFDGLADARYKRFRKFGSYDEITIETEEHK